MYIYPVLFVVRNMNR